MFIETFVIFWDKNYDERTDCTPVMMRGPIYASYDEGAYCPPVMMRGPIVRQL